ncbi:MAG: hypothetical protein LBO03_02225 [Acidaminococcales bacterium]|nr:hypothetical protein [Acidaminococcales bacterium]
MGGLWDKSTEVKYCLPKPKFIGRTQAVNSHFHFCRIYRSNKRTGAGNPAPQGKEKLPGQQFLTSVDPAIVLK